MHQLRRPRGRSSDPHWVSWPKATQKKCVGWSELSTSALSTTATQTFEPSTGLERERSLPKIMLDSEGLLPIGKPPPTEPRADRILKNGHLRQWVSTSVSCPYSLALAYNKSKEGESQPFVGPARSRGLGPSLPSRSGQAVSCSLLMT